MPTPYERGRRAEPSRTGDSEVTAPSTAPCGDEPLPSEQQCWSEFWRSIARIWYTLPPDIQRQVQTRIDMNREAELAEKAAYVERLRLARAERRREARREASRRRVEELNQGLGGAPGPGSTHAYSESIGD